MTFSEIDGQLLGAAGVTVRLARSWAERWGFARAYSRGKASLSTLVGWNSPMLELSSEAAYDIVIDRLIEQCEKGDDVYWARVRKVVA